MPIISFLFLISCSTAKKREKLIIYLHGMGKEPLKAERVNINRIKAYASKEGYLFLSPKAKSTCDYLSPKRTDLKCWDHKNIDKEVKNIFRNHSNKSKEIIIIGFSNGGYLLGGALQRGYLKNVSKVGIVSGGAIGTLSPKEKLVPKVFIEIGTEDKWNRKWGEKLYSLLSENNHVYYRNIKRNHFPNPNQLESFINWIISTK